MSEIELDGLNGSSPLCFLAALGILRLTSERGSRLGFRDDGSFRPFIAGFTGDLGEVVAADAAGDSPPQAWRLAYQKSGKRPREVRDLKPPPGVFGHFLEQGLEEWLAGHEEKVAYGSAFGSSVAVDGKGNTKPTALHFSAGQQEWLATVEEIRVAVTADWARESLFEGQSLRVGANLRWDPGADRNRALMAIDPSGEKTVVDAPLEWLAFRALPLLPAFPRGSRLLTTCVHGHGDEMTMTWPLWTGAASVSTVRSLLVASQGDGPPCRGVFAVCRSRIQRTTQGYGNFCPASIS